MHITLDTNPFSKIETEALVTYLFEDSDLLHGQADEIDRAIRQNEAGEEGLVE